LTALQLEPHPATPCSWIHSVTASFTRDSSGVIAGRYVLDGAIQHLRIPSAAVLPTRSDGLWRTTCFELFARASPGQSYSEFNFSPSGRWAAYQFESYRQGMKQLAIAAPAVTCEQQGGSLILTAVLPAPGLGASPLQIAASAVLEDLEGRIYYWALQHPDGKPDFHHDAGFAARI
jgi:hypothetical protein